MEELKKLLEEKRMLVSHLMIEIRKIETTILEEQWKGIPECKHLYEAVREGACEYVSFVHNSNIYCNNRNCHK